MRTYRSGIDRYANFCNLFSLPLFPLSEDTLCRFVVYLAQSGLSHLSIRSYLSALRFHQISLGGPDPSISSLPRLHYVIKGIRRSQPSHTCPRRLPITPAILLALHSIWSQSPDFNTVALWAACCLGFFAFMRAGEFTCPSWKAYTPLMLSPSDIHIDSRLNPTCITVSLRHSKTDVFGAGVSITVGATGNILCPVAAVLSYMARRPQSTGPLFLLENGIPLSCRLLVQNVRQALSRAGIDTSNYSGHSFRIGAATTASLAGIPDSTIQELGRWKSSAFVRYIRVPSNYLSSVSRRLATTHTSTP